MGLSIGGSMKKRGMLMNGLPIAQLLMAAGGENSCGKIVIL